MVRCSVHMYPKKSLEHNLRGFQRDGASPKWGQILENCADVYPHFVNPLEPKNGWLTFSSSSLINSFPCASVFDVLDSHKLSSSINCWRFCIASVRFVSVSRNSLASWKCERPTYNRLQNDIENLSVKRVRIDDQGEVEVDGKITLRCIISVRVSSQYKLRKK